MISKDDYKAKTLSRIHGSRLEDFFFFAFLFHLGI